MKYLEIFLSALKLGLTSFGGPVAHLGYFHQEYVKKKKWISEHAYADLVALCQFLPGPASSQVGIAIGLSRGNLIGAFLSWLGFTLPTALILILLGLGVTHFDISHYQNQLHSLKVVAVAVVAQAVFVMGKKLCPDWPRVIIALASTSTLLALNSSSLMQISLLIISAIIGTFYFKNSNELPHEPFHQGSRRKGAISLSLFLGLLFLLPLLSFLFKDRIFELIDGFYQAGALVFGGGHVILPLLQAQVVETGLIDNNLFMAGYGASNAMPGPLVAFSAYLGTVISGVSGGVLSLVAAFLPSYLLVVGILPFWEKLRKNLKIRRAMLGLNAAVVGILLAALYNPVWTSTIFSLKDFAVALIAFVLLEFFKIASWIVIFIALGASFFIY